MVQIAAISAGGHPGHASDLYQYLISKPEFSTSTARQALVRRLREALMKLVSVVGVPKPLEAVFCIAAVEKEEDRDLSFSRYVIYLRIGGATKANTFPGKAGSLAQITLPAAENGSTKSISTTCLRMRI